MANPPHGNAKPNTSFSDSLFSFTRFLAILHPAMQNYSRFIKKVAVIFGTFKIYVQICSVNLLPIAETYLKWGLALLNEKASLMLCPLAHWNLRNFSVSFITTLPLAIYNHCFGNKKRTGNKRFSKSIFVPWLVAVLFLRCTYYQSSVQRFPNWHFCIQKKMCARE